jgi:hypothetical protein
MGRSQHAIVKWRSLYKFCLVKAIRSKLARLVFVKTNGQILGINCLFLWDLSDVDKVLTARSSSKTRSQNFRPPVDEI